MDRIIERKKIQKNTQDAKTPDDFAATAGCCCKPRFIQSSTLLPLTNLVHTDGRKKQYDLASTPHLVSIGMGTTKANKKKQAFAFCDCCSSQTTWFGSTL